MGLGLLVVPPEGVCFCFCAWFEGGVVFVVAVGVEVWASASAAGVSREQRHEKEEPSAALQVAEEEAESAGG
jgi:hypothetical protein